MSTADVQVPRLLSVSILHRHGARGPGASEMAPFTRVTDVNSQWEEVEFEVLSTVGHDMITTLGTWFAKKYSSIFLTPKVMFRCSKSGRAIESGLDFVQAFNAAVSTECSSVSEKSTPFAFTSEKYQICEDYFFRPWKIERELTEQAKKNAKNDEKFAGIATKNEKYLNDLFLLAGAKEEYTSNSYKSFWSTTYIFALIECEKYWEKPLDRNALSTRIPVDLRGKLEELACRVWERRFLHSGSSDVIGAPLSIDLFQQLFNDGCNMSIYSAHDYSILAVIGSLGIVPSLDCATSFGSYLTFELWEGVPPVHSSAVSKVIELNLSDSDKTDESDGSVDKDKDVKNENSENDCEECGMPCKKRARSASVIKETVSDNRFIRISANFRPFPESEGVSGSISVSKVDESNETVLAVYSIVEVRSKLEVLNESLTSRNMYSPYVIIK